MFLAGQGDAPEAKCCNSPFPCLRSRSSTHLREPLKEQKGSRQGKDLAKKLVLVFSKSTYCGQLNCVQCEAWASQSKWVLPWGSGEEGSGPVPFLTDSPLCDLTVVEHTEGMWRV